MDQDQEAHGAASWRRRHPVLSRSLLYGAALALIALAIWLLQRRGAVDRQDQLDQLEARLAALDVLFVMDRQGDQVLKVLDEEFNDPDLPPHIRQRVLRARAFSHLKRGQGDEALAALDAAAALAGRPLDREVIRLERAQALVLGDRFADAQALLKALPAPTRRVLAIWRGLLSAQALVGLERTDDAVLALDTVLEALPRPLPVGSPVVVALTPWTVDEAAIFATLALSDIGGGPADARPWQRLLALAPRDLGAAQEAAKALWQGGHIEEGARAWAWAVSLNGGRAPENGVSDPVLTALEKNRVEGLKIEDQGGR